MSLLEALSHLLSGTAGAAIILASLKAFAAWEKKQGRGESLPAYKNKFFDELGDMMRAHTEEIRTVNSHLAKYDPLITAVDQNNYPKVWSDHEQLRRTHENVNNLMEINEELVKVVQDTYLEVKKNA
jgi:hypothetical protein